MKSVNTLSKLLTTLHDNMCGLSAVVGLVRVYVGYSALNRIFQREKSGKRPAGR